MLLVTVGVVDPSNDVTIYYYIFSLIFSITLLLFWNNMNIRVFKYMAKAVLALVTLLLLVIVG